MAFRCIVPSELPSSGRSDVVVEVKVAQAAAGGGRVVVVGGGGGVIAVVVVAVRRRSSSSRRRHRSGAGSRPSPSSSSSSSSRGGRCTSHCEGAGAWMDTSMPTARDWEPPNTCSVQPSRAAPV